MTPLGLISMEVGGATTVTIPSALVGSCCLSCSISVPPTAADKPDEEIFHHPAERSFHPYISIV